jgi:ribosomal protein S18 acetylase RimI-like enzyme
MFRVVQVSVQLCIISQALCHVQSFHPLGANIVSREWCQEQVSTKQREIMRRCTTSKPLSDVTPATSNSVADNNDIIRIRRATKSDIPAISELSTAIFYGSDDFSSSLSPPNLFQKTALFALDYWDISKRLEQGYKLEGALLRSILMTSGSALPAQLTSLALPCEVFVATCSDDNNKIVGCAEITLRPSSSQQLEQQRQQASILGVAPKPTLRPTITNLCVSPLVRRQGVGSSLLKNCEEAATGWLTAYQEESMRIDRATKWLLKELLTADAQNGDDEKDDNANEDTNEQSARGITEISQPRPADLSSDEKYKDKDWEWLRLARLASLSSNKKNVKTSSKPPAGIVALDNVVLGVNEQNLSAITFYERNGYDTVLEKMRGVATRGNKEDNEDDGDDDEPPIRKPVILSGAKFNTSGPWLNLESYRKIEMMKLLIVDGID